MPPGVHDFSLAVSQPGKKSLSFPVGLLSSLRVRFPVLVSQVELRFLFINVLHFLLLIKFSLGNLAG